MSKAEQPEALALAEWAECFVRNVNNPKDFRWTHMAKAAAELRRQHARIDELKKERDAIQKVSAMNARSGAAWAARVQELEAQLAAIGAGGVEPLRSRQCLHQISEPIRWPKDAKEVREFFRSDFIRAEFVQDDQEPCDEDRYYISAHDFLSAINWWADFPHHHPSQSPSSADEGGSNG